MKRIPTLLFAAASLCCVSLANDAQEPQKPLTVEAINAHGSLTGNAPGDLRWSPDGSHLTYVDGGELMDIDPVTGKGRVLVSRAKLASLAGAKDSEQDRDHRDRYKMASYIWAPDSVHLLFDSDGRLWLYDLRNGTGLEIGFTGAASGDDPKFSPNGDAISYVRDHGLQVLRLRDPGTPAINVAPATNPNILNGEVDWVYLEELDVRSNYFWAPDAKRLAFLRTDETNVPQYPITDWITTHATVNEQRYPQPGDANPDVSIGVVSATGGKIVWMKLPIKAGQDYIPRFGWVDRKTLWIETLTRDHKHQDIYFADASSGRAHVALQLSDDKFFDETYNVSVGPGQLVLTNWADGHNHLYLYSFDQNHLESVTARLERQLTRGDFEVGDVLDVDFERKRIEYQSNEGDPLDQQLWQVTLDGDRTQLSAGPGTHEGNFAPGGNTFVDRQSTRMNPPTLHLCQTAGKCKLFWMGPALDAYHLHAPEKIEVKAHDGETLYATLLLPNGVTDSASVPLIVNPYGGPGPMEVANNWSDGLFFDELLTEHGFAVLHADNRGMGKRGRTFAQACYHNFGPVQLEDQLTVVDAVLARYPQLDGKRLGWWGWSWGGTFTLYAMTHSDRFRAGVSVAPVTDWRNYDSIYTERYMSEPADFPEGYKDFSVVNSAAHLKGRLLLAHGTGDDNVHMQNSIQFIQKLIDAGIPYDVQLFPRKTHSIAGPEARTELFSRILAHFEQYLKPEVAH